MARPWPQPPRLCPRTPTTIPTACLLSVPQQSFDRSSQAHARETFSPSRVPLSSQKGELRRNQGAQRQAWILAFGMRRPHSDTCQRRLLRCLFSHGRLMGATQLARQLAGQTLPRSSSTRVSLRVLYWEDWVEVGWGNGVSAPPHTHTHGWAQTMPPIEAELNPAVSTPPSFSVPRTC